MGLKAAGHLLLGLLLGATAWIAVSAAPQRPPAPGAETTHWLAAHSLAIDHDELYVDADAARFRAAFGEAPRGVRSEPKSDRLEAPYLATRLWSWALALGGERGPFLLHFLAFALAAFAASRALRAALGGAAPLWMALFLFGSTAFTAVFRWQSEVLVFAAVVLAGALAWGRDTGTADAKGADEIYGGDLAARAAFWPWPLAGLLVGAAAVRHPAYALLALPMLVDLWRRPRSGQRLGILGLFALSVVLPVGVVLALHGAPWEAPAAVWSAALTGWNALFFIAGRNAGLLVGFLPVAALLLAPRSTGGRRYLPLVVMSAALVQVLMAPFDWAGGSPAVGNLSFLPLYGALLFCAGPALRLRGALLLAFAVAPFLAPYWLAPLSNGAEPPQALAPFTSGIRERLPFETSLRDLPASPEIVRGGVRLRATGPGLRPAKGKLALAASRAVVLVESDRALTSVRLDFSASAPAALAVEGGKTASTTFRPNGEVAFEIALGDPARRHPLWWSRSPVSIYLLRLELPEAGRMAGQGSASAAEPVTFDLGLARVAGPEAENP